MLAARACAVGGHQDHESPLLRHSKHERAGDFIFAKETQQNQWNQTKPNYRKIFRARALGEKWLGAFLNLYVFGFSFVVFHDKTARRQEVVKEQSKSFGI